MLATIDRPAKTKTSRLLEMTFNEDDRVLDVTVIISHGEKPGTYHHHVPPLSVAGPGGSNWTVIWTLAPVKGVSATFRDGGVCTTSVPAGVNNHNSKGIVILGTPEAPPIKWQFSFTNNVTDVNVIRYDLLLDVKDSEGNPLARHPLIIDPTISVVREPLG